MTIKDRAAEAKNASIQLAAVSTNIKNSALKAISRALEKGKRYRVLNCELSAWLCFLRLKNSIKMKGTSLDFISGDDLMTGFYESG